MTIFIFFIFYKLFDFLISNLSPYFIKIQGFFPYRDLIESYRLPQILTSFANFDGAHYISIANHGYAQYEQAFFPLYPLLIRFLSSIFDNNRLLTGLIISNAAFIVSLFILKKYLDLLFNSEKSDVSENRKQIIREQKSEHQIFKASVFRFLNSVFSHPKNLVIIFLLSFPTSFFFGAVYTEGLFFLFTVLTFYFLQKERYLFAGIFAMLAALTRFAGLFLVIPMILNLKSQAPNHKQILNSNNKNSKQKSFETLNFGNWNLFGNWKLGFGFLKLTAIIFPILGLSIYSLYLYYATGDPLLFFHSQADFNLNRSTNLILLPQVYFRYLKIFLTASHNFQYFISLFEFIVFNLVFSVLILDLKKIIEKRKEWSRPFPTRLGLNLFSFANILIPTFTGTLLSIPRFALLSLSFYIYLAEIKSKTIKIIIASIFILFHIIFLSYFVRGYFIS